MLRTIKNFGKKISPPFSNKIKSKEKIALVENDEIISSDIEVVKTFQNFFTSIVKNLNIQRDETHLSKTTQDIPVLACIEKFSTHPSIISIQKRNSKNSLLNMKKEKNFLQKSKILTPEQNDIPVKILKENSGICSYTLYHNFNSSLFSNKFQKSHKRADITPIFKER